MSPKEAICLKCQFCFLGKIRKTIKFSTVVKLSSAASTQRVVKVNTNKMVLAAFSLGPQHLENTNIDQTGAGIM